MKTRLLVLAVALTSLAFVGCSSPSEASSGPERAYVNDGMVLVNVADTADTFTNTASTGVYRNDGAGDYLYDGHVVAFDESSADVFTIKADGKTYINAYFMNANGRFEASGIWFRFYEGSAGKVVLEFSSGVGQDYIVMARDCSVFDYRGSNIFHLTAEELDSDFTYEID